MGIRSPELTINVDLVRRLIAEQFPQWRHLPIRAVEPGGWDNRTFRLGEHMLVRLPSSESYALQVEKEQTWLPKLAPHLPLPIPTPLGRGAPSNDFPLPWSVYDWLDGQPAGDGVAVDLPALASDLAAFLVALRGIDASDGPLPGPHNFQRGGPPAYYDAEVRSSLVTLHGRIDIGRAGAIWDKALASHWTSAPVWFHGDIAWGNLLMRDGRLSAIIDFGTSGVEDPACDLAIAWTMFDATSRATFRDALGLDDNTWARGRGWTLWKALIAAAGHDANQREAAKAFGVIETLLTED